MSLEAQTVGLLLSAEGSAGHPSPNCTMVPVFHLVLWTFFEANCLQAVDFYGFEQSTRGKNIYTVYFRDERLLHQENLPERPVELGYGASIFPA